jgi:D-proline reductase (dithiol) PrdB
VIGQLNNVWWSLSPFIPDAVSVAEQMAPAIAERLARYEVHAALLIPASRLCHQTLGVIARVIEQSGIPTMMISVDPDLSDQVRPPRTAYYDGEFGSVAGKPNFKQYQLRVLDESIRWIETFDQPGSKKLAVDIQTQVEAARGER